MADSTLVLNSLSHISKQYSWGLRLGPPSQDLAWESHLLFYEVIQILLDVLNVFTTHTSIHPSAISDCKSLLRPSIAV